MRSYTGTLLFEESLNLVPGGTDISRSINKLCTPEIPIVTSDCGTLLGDLQPVSLDILGRKRLSDGSYLTRADLIAFDPSGVDGNYIRLRSISTCIAPGGLCLACYYSLNPPA